MSNRRNIGLSKSVSSTDGNQSPSNRGLDGNELWTDGLLCAYEYIPGHVEQLHFGGELGHGSGLPAGKFDGVVKSLDIAAKPSSQVSKSPDIGEQGRMSSEGKPKESHWVPIGWKRLAELCQTVQIDADWCSSTVEDVSSRDLLSVADVAAPYWERPSGPTWWCNVLAGHSHVDSWLTDSQWLHPAVSHALKDESRLISDRMKHLFYEVPVRVAGGLLFELLGHSVGDPHHEEEDVPIVLRSWQAQRYLITSLHVKGAVNTLNVLGIMEVQDLIGAGGADAPKSVFEVIAYLASRLSRWDDRLFRKNIFGAADEVELKFVNRRGNEDLALLSMILNQEIRRLSSQVIRVKWSLHAREEIILELSQYLKGSSTQEVLASIRRATRDMIGEQEAVRDRIFTVQDAIHNTVRSKLQDKSVRITHNLAVFGGCGLVLSIITGLFGINVDGIPGSSQAPYTFLIFSTCLICLGIILVGLGFLYLGLKKPITDRQLAARKLELQQLVKSFQHAAESHAKVRNGGSFSPLGEEQGGNTSRDDYDYILIL